MAETCYARGDINSGDASWYTTASDPPTTKSHGGTGLIASGDTLYANGNTVTWTNTDGNYTLADTGFQVDDATAISSGTLTVSGVLTLVGFAGTGTINGLTVASGGVVNDLLTSISPVNILDIQSGGTVDIEGQFFVTTSIALSGTLSVGISGFLGLPGVAFTGSGGLLSLAGTSFRMQSDIVAAASVLITVPRWTGASGAGNVGTVTLPEVSKVLDDTSFGASLGQTGTYKAIAQADARKNGTGAYYGAASSVNGTCVVPVATNVKSGVSVDVSDTGSYSGSGMLIID